MATLGELKRQRYAVLVEAGQKQYEQRRGSASQRKYGVRHRKQRAAYLAAHPVCELAGCKRAATDLDHVVPLARGGQDEEANWQALCHRHHSRKTNMEDGGFGNR